MRIPQEVLGVVPWVWARKKGWIWRGSMGWFVLTTYSLALIKDSSSDKLKEERTGGRWEKLLEDFLDSSQTVEHEIGDYNITDFRNDIKKNAFLHVKFHDIDDMSIEERGDGNALIVFYDDGKKIQKCDFASVSSTVDGMGGKVEYFKWDVVRKTIKKIQRLKKRS